jgi:sensor histidine kinase regulating citrate/malate metabolism
MKQSLKLMTRLTMVLLVAALAMGGATSCKSKKKLAAEQAAAEYAKKVDQAKQDLNAIINRTSDWTIDEQRQKLAAIKAENLDDPDVQKLISLAEKEIDYQQAELDRKAEEERLRKEEEARQRALRSEYAVYDNQFKAIAGASSVDMANQQIDAALQNFASPNVPVLIIISQVDGINDYDKPTTAAQFLNYLKDVKKYDFEVASMKTDSNGKVTELELLKKW